MPAGKRQIAGAFELAAQRVVLLLAGLNDLVLQVPNRFRQPLGRGVDRARERRVDCLDRLAERRGLVADVPFGRLNELIDRCREVDARAGG